MEGAVRPRRGERQAACVTALPPGPVAIRAAQSMRWASEPLPMLEQCQERYGDTFTLRLRHLGTWVVLADPEDVKRVFSDRYE